MALKEQDVVLTTKDASGNTVIQMPITRVQNVEDAPRTVNGVAPDKNGNVVVSNMSAATASAAGKAGLVPAPAAGKQTQFLRGDGTWQTPTDTKYSVMTAATSSAAGKAGLVPAPAAGKQTQFLRGDGAWAAVDSVGGAVPSGTILAYAGRTVPAGYLICNGAAVSRTTYAALFAAIGTIYGAGDGSTTFNLPNLSDRFLEGTTDTSKVGTYLEAGLPDITGTVKGIDTGGYQSLFSCDGAFEHIKNTGSHYSFGDYQMQMQGFSMSGSRFNSLYGGSAKVQPSSIYALMIIKK